MISHSTIAQERFWAKVTKTRSCWFWNGHILINGYGQFRLDNNIRVVAHRYSYQLAKGNINRGLVIDHLCRNKSCINPKHLEAVSQSENIRRGDIVLKKKSQLPIGIYKNGSKFVASKYMNGKNVHLGIFGTIAEASQQLTINISGIESGL